MSIYFYTNTSTHFTIKVHVRYGSYGNTFKEASPMEMMFFYKPVYSLH